MKDSARRTPQPGRRLIGPSAGGLFRHQLAGPGRSVKDAFAALRHERGVELIAEHPERQLQAARYMIDRSDGHGAWEFYQLEQDLFVVTGDFIYDAPRVERVPGEELIALHLRLSGRLQIDLPDRASQLVVEGPSLLIWMQPAGCEITEHTQPGIRDSSVTLYCKPA